ncbi:amino acid adenylation domain-containing protein [Nostoc sp. CHAB 5836]|uniref:non-ribosomal peptide synthetase n=1 Tax=Nostoc sp. CHAB 5836 TaxID=2780404 RepID=UPI001E2FCDFD|nr:non-ribosomal peptide synthetase [Nostoc sp. CHAB 5836]MCC5616018.1 amino acid adenylation domain-containing protein [Nostoc sp. CHAB 5836]
MSVKNKNIEEFYPLSPMQQGILFHSIAAPQSGIYFEQFSLTLQGKLNISEFHRAWQYVVERHSILRTCFVWEGLKEPVQIVHRQVSLPWQEYNWQHLSPEEQQQKLELFLQSDRSRGFELTQPPLMRLTLVQLSDISYNLIWSHHHLLLDGWSVPLVFKEVFACYKAFSNAQDVHLEPIRPYRDYIVWLQQQNLSEAETFWRQTLKGFTTPTQLSVNKAAIKLPDQTDSSKEQEVKLSVATTAGLQSVAKQHQLTLNTLLQGAWALLLSRYSGQEDVVFGSVTSGRPPTLAKVESMVGLLINTLPIRVQISPEEFLLPWLHKIKEQLVEAHQYEYTPLVKIQGWSEVPKDLSLFESIVVFENYPIDASLRQSNINLEIKDFHSFEKTNYPITLTVIPGEELLLKITCDDSVGVARRRHRFDTDTITRMLGHLQTLLEGMVTKTEQRLGELSLLTETERHQLIVEWNGTEVEYPQQLCIHELFEAQVEKTPDAVAVVFEDQELTYSELNAKANQLAHYLQKLGVKPEVLVGICLERSIEMIVGLLAILKAGGAYIPLDPSYPQERLAFILEDTQTPVLLTQTSLLQAIPQHKAQVVCLDADWHNIAQQSQENLLSELATDLLAYVIYTSGSTGKPKGVQIPHSALSNFLYSMRQTPGLTHEDTLLAVTTYSFDIAALELFLPIIVGGFLVIASREVASDGTQLSVLLTNSKATVMQATPATWQLLLAAGWSGNEQLKILCGGEALPGQLANELLHRCASLWNMYGPTETTIWSAASQVENGSTIVPISRAIANTQLYILDQYSQLVPVGVVGELHIGGNGLARSYFNRPDLTAEKFIPNPFSKKAERLYKTGDLARYLPNGEIEYLGRIDHQVKVRGFRIELGEIEAVISQYLAVQETVVVVCNDAADLQQIVAYLVPQTEQTLTITQLRSFLELKLPTYMIPGGFVILEALPLTPNGKVDRQALPIPEFTQISSSNIILPSTPIENLLAGIWAEILGIEKVSIDHNFFELGGHSLIATRVISRIRQVFQVELPLRYLFEKPTIAGLAKEIEKALKVDSGDEVTKIEQIVRSPELPLSYAQQRLWFLDRLEPNSSFYNMPAAVRLEGQLNVEALEQSFNEIISRHEVLRTNFQTREGQAIAVISQEMSLILPIFDLRELTLNQQEAEVKKQASEEAQQAFSLKEDLLLRVKLLRLGESEHIILLTMHHIVSDGWSIDILVRELATLYQAFCDGQPSPLPGLPIQYVDFAAWQRQWLQEEVLKTQISYWLKQLENAPKVLELPTDYPRPVIQTFRGSTYSFKLSEQLSVGLNKFSQQQGSTLFMTLLAAFQTLLWRYTGSEDIVVGSPIANRNLAEIEGLIGFFVNTLVLRTNLAGNPSFEELLKRVREVTLGAYSHQDLPFELLVEELQPERDLSHTPLFQVMFVLQNAPMSALELSGLTLNFLESNSNSAKFDLTLYITETVEGLIGNLEYNTDLFEESSVQRMAAHLQMLLEGIIANPQQRLSELPLLTESERHQLIVEWNGTEVEYPQQCIHELFEAQVEKTPNAVAVVFEQQQLTYRELNAKANQLAHYLQKLGVKPEVLVGICLERSIEMIVGLLAILKAGGAYVPIDPMYPPERIGLILHSAQVSVLLTQQHLIENFPKHRTQIICLDTDWQTITQQNQTNPISDCIADNLAYIIYTSGSTGQPKGVLVNHANVARLLAATDSWYNFNQQDVWTLFHSIAFDFSVWEIWGALLYGGKLIVVPYWLSRSPEDFYQLLLTQQVTILNQTPSAFRQLIQVEESLENSNNLRLRAVIFGGEALQIESLRPWFERHGDKSPQLVNMYGITETTVHVTYRPLTMADLELASASVIGRPIPDLQVYLLDSYQQPVAIGIPGELHIGGLGLARGYLNQPELTALKFIPNPFSKQEGDRLYKTGDLVRFLSSGDIEYLGRIDNQVKIRGFRVELGEIEAAIIQHPSVSASVVMLRENKSGNQSLIAYTTLHQDKTLTIPELRRFLKNKLLDHMIPNAFMILEALPLTSNGKVDRQALPIPNALRPELEVDYVIPQTEVEKTIASVWQKALNLEKIGIHDNFFEIGGHSLLLVTVHSQLQEILKSELSTLDLFRYPTINSLAEYLSSSPNSTALLQENDTQAEKISSGKAQQRKRLQKMKSVENN